MVWVGKAQSRGYFLNRIIGSVQHNHSDTDFRLQDVLVRRNAVFLAKAAYDVLLREVHILGNFRKLNVFGDVPFYV